MINIGTIISGYTVIAVADGYILAENTSSPEPYVVWNESPICARGVQHGRYFTDRMEAEWEFCGLAFEWFQDNVLISCEEEITVDCRADEKRIAQLEEHLSEAHRALAAATELVEELFAEHERLCPEEDRVTDEPVEKVADEFAKEAMSSSQKRDAFNVAMSMLEGLQAGQMLRRKILHNINEAAEAGAPLENAAERKSRACADIVKQMKS